MRIRYRLLISAIVIVTLLATAWKYVSLQRQGSVEWLILSENSIHAIILKNTPPGTDLQTCMDYIKFKMQPELGSIYLDERNGALHSGISSKMIGSKSIKAVLVSQKEPWSPIFHRTYVSFGFDNNNKLVDVVVEKELDGP